MLVSVESELLTVRPTDPEIPPPGVGLETLMGNVPDTKTSAAVSCAVNWVALTNVVARSTPLSRTMEVLTKFVPLTVNTKAASPALLLLGERALTVGEGLLTV